MVKSLEQYLSELSFAPPGMQPEKGELSAGERVFVEKYLGLDALGSLPRIDPEPLLQPVVPAPQAKVRLAEPEIRVATPKLVVAPEAREAQKEFVETPLIQEPQLVVAQPVTREELKEEPEDTKLAVEEPVMEIARETTEIREALPPVSPPAPPAFAATDKLASAELSLKESMRQQAEIQAVSFFVAGQLFLLPVEGIQEVLRHMELVRVPQAPPFVAGVINLRGKVTPLVHLSAILTNITDYAYDPEKNFIIICGTEPLQIGLIIDRINSMHLLPQDKIIWNVEAKLGEAADFLYAIVNLDEKVCGMVAPEMITRKILASES